MIYRHLESLIATGIAAVPRLLLVVFRYLDKQCPPCGCGIGGVTFLLVLNAGNEGMRE
jgi:hypothetical protein